MMDKIKDYIPHFWIIIMSYLLATHYLFQWWNSLILAIVLMILVTIARRFLTRQTFRNRMFITIFIILLLWLIPNYNNTSFEYNNCAYKPFEITGTSIDLEVSNHPVYYGDDTHEGLYSFGADYVELYDIKNNQNHLYDFNKGDSIINSVAYYDGFLYIAGFNIIDYPMSELNNFAVVRIDLETNTDTTFFETPYYTNVHVINDELYILDEDNGLRVYSIYNETGFKEYDYSFGEDYILDTYTHNEHTVVVTKDNDYYLYTNNVVQSLYSPLDVNRRYVTIDDSGIYIVDEMISTNRYNITKYDFQTNDSNTSFRVSDISDYVIETDNYIITNNGLFSGEYYIESSLVTKTNGKNVCNASYTDDLVVYKLNGKLYGEINNYLYEIEEKTFSVPIKWSNPQSGFFYILAIISILIYINKKDRFRDMNFRTFNFGNMGSNFRGRGFNINDFINQEKDDDNIYDDYEN